MLKRIITWMIVVLLLASGGFASIAAAENYSIARIRQQVIKGRERLEKMEEAIAELESKAQKLVARASRRYGNKHPRRRGAESLLKSVTEYRKLRFCPRPGRSHRQGPEYCNIVKMAVRLEMDVTQPRFSDCDQLVQGEDPDLRRACEDLGRWTRGLERAVDAAKEKLNEWTEKE